jgi:hypothetical protein
LDNDMTQQEEAPPIFKSWKRFYLVVFFNLVFLIVLFFAFTKAFE